MKKNLLLFKNTEYIAVGCENPNCKKIKGSPGNCALRIVKQLLFTFMVLLFIQGMARGQDPASATWALTENGNASTSGNVTATSLVADYGVNVPQYSFIGVYTSGWCHSSLIMDGHDYYEFTISPKTGNNLTVTNIAFLHSKSGSVVGNGAIYYSLDDFSSSAQFGSNFLIENVVPSLSFSNSTSITVTDGQTLKIRIYAWGLNCSDAFYIKDFIISGTTGSILSVTPANLNFGEVCTSLSNELTFNLTGSFLTGAVSISAPGGFSVLPASVTPSGGRIDETISVIFNPDAVQSYSGNITVSGGGANSVNVVVTGYGKDGPSTATNPSPANGATGLSYTGSGAVSNVSWDAVSGATSYDVYFGAGSLPGSPTANVGTHSYSTGVLSASTTYHWKIVPKNDCGATTGTPVEWTFTTINSPIITVSAASLDFGAACLNSSSPEQSYTISGTSLTGTIEIIPPSGFVISMDGGESFEPNYNLKITSSDGTGSISNIPIYVRFAPTAAQAYSGNISHTATGATSKNVAVTGTGITAPSVAANPYPSNGATGVCYTGSGAISSVSWDPVPGATSYDIYFGPGSLPVSPSAIVTNNTYLFWDELSASTTYHWKVVPKNSCGSTTGTPAEWTFTTNDHLCYCRPSSTNVETYIHNFSATGNGTSDISNSGTGYTPYGYADYSESQSVSQFTNQLVSWSLTFATPGGVRPAGFSLWVDWNNNGFGAGDNVYITSSSQVPGTYTGSFTVPSGMDPGEYKMRVFVDANNGSPNDPCNFTPYYFLGYHYLGEAEDYTLQVKAGNPPVISVSTASLSFEEVCANAGSSEQFYTVSGSDLTTDIVINPPAGFEISKTSGTGFANSAVTLTQTAGSVTSIPIYVRFSPASTGEISCNITHTSTGATTKNIAVTGTGLAAPIADFTGSPTNVKTGESITFTNISTNTPTSWSWSFPGGSPSSSTGQNPMVTYDVAGTYSVSLTATNGCGSDTETKTDYITVTALCITPVATAPSAGDGTSGNPWQIASLENLYWISASDDVVPSPSQAARFGSHYLQVADIDASPTVSWCNGGWNPVGYDNEDNWYMCTFRGTYNGQGHTISGLHIGNSSPQRSFGFFGRMVGATIQNLGIINVDISNANGSSGALAGYAEGCIINNCYSNGNITVSDNTSDDAGGLVGDLFINSKMTNCYSTCNVSAPYFAGGLVGHNNSSSISKCYFMTGTVTGLNSYSTAGGLVGYNNFNASISRCFSSGLVKGINNMGGLVGANHGNSSISNCYSRTDLQSDISNPDNIGGLVGANLNNAIISSCYSTGFVGSAISGLVGYHPSGQTINSFWDKETSGSEWNITYVGVTGKTTAEMKTQSTFTDWDFINIWSIDATMNDGYPSFTPESVCTDGTIALTSASGTANQFVCVSSAITYITYTIGGGATGAEATGLPDGVIGNFSNGSFTISGTPDNTGTYDFTITTEGTPSACWEATAYGTITVVDPNAAPAAIAGPITVCEGEEGVIYSVDIVPGATSYNWSLPTGTVITAGTGTNSITVTLGSKSGTVSVSADNACGTTAPSAKEITVNSMVTPSVTITSSDTDNNICFGTMVTFTATPSNTGGGTVAYKWYLNEITYDSWNQSTWSHGDLDENGYDQVRCEITVTGGTCLTSATAVSNIINNEVYNRDATPSVTISSDAIGEVCYGTYITLTATAENTGGGDVTYQWYHNGTLIGGNQPTYSSSELYNGQVVSCDITVTDAACFASATASSNLITAAVTTRPEAGTIDGTPEIYVGNTVKFNVTGNDRTGTWGSYDESIATVDQTGNVTGVGAGSTTIGYLVEVDKSCPYDYDVAEFVITVTADICTPPVPTFTESPASPQCIDNEVTYTTQPDKNKYVWNIPGTESTDYEISSGGTSLDNTVILTWLTEGSKTVTVNYTEDCEGVTPAGSTITVNSLPIADAGTFDDVCTDAGYVTLVGSPTGGVWTGTGVSGNQTDGYVFDPTENVGDITLTYIYTDGNSCLNSDEATIHVDAVYTAYAGKDQSQCNNSTFTISAGSLTKAAIIGPSGIWELLGEHGTAQITENYLETTTVTNVPFDQDITLRYTLTNGACSDFDDVVLRNNSLPIADAGTYAAVCIDGSDVELVGTPAGGTWSGIGVSGNYFDPSAGTQTVTYTYEDTNGCTNSDAALITVNPLQTVDAGTYGPVCENAGDVVLVGSPTGGIWEGTGVSGDLESGYVFDPSGHVGYNTLTYTYTGDNGCSNSDQTTIRVYYLPDCLLYEPGLVESDPVLPNSTHFYTTHGTGSYKWTIEGNGRIKGYDDKVLVEVIAGENCNEPYTLSLTVTNNVTKCSSTCSKEVNVNDTEGPYPVNPLNTSARLDAKDNNWCLEVADAFDGSNLQNNVKALYSDNGGAVSAICTGKTAGADNSNCNWTFTYHYTVQDECFNSTTCDVVYSGGDTEAPELIDPTISTASLNSEGKNWCLSEADAYDAAELQKAVALLYKDNCSTTIAKYTGKTAGDSNADCSWTFTYHFTVSDECGRSTDCNVVYSGGDTEEPVAICQNIKVQLDKDGFASIDNDAVNNGSNDNCSSLLNFATDITSFDCSNVGPNTVELTITDDCGKFSTCQSTVTVEDNIAPALTCPSASPFTRSTDLNCTYYTVVGTEFDATATDACCTPVTSYACAGASVPSGTTMAGIQLPVGKHTIFWMSEDINGNKSTGQIEVTVQKRSAVLTYTGDLTEQYSDETSLSAKLADETDTPVSGKTIRFTIGTQSVTDITGENGIATATLKLDQSPVPAYSVKTEFEGDDTSMPATDEDPFDILQENATTVYTGQEFIGEQNPSLSTTPLTLSVSVTDINDSYRGDIRNARVQFYDVNTLAALSGWLTPGLVLPVDPTEGVVVHTWNAPVPATGYNTFTVGVRVGTQNPEDNGYYTGADKTVVNVYRTDLYEFISGGGHIIPAQSKGTYASDPGRKVNFGFNVKWNKTLKNLQGNLNLVFRKGEKVYQIKANSMSSLSINSMNPCSQQAYFTSKANLTDATLPALPIEIQGNLSLQVSITNNTSPGAVSTIGFTVYDGNTLLYSSSWPANKTEELPLAGGNLIVHNGIECIINNDVDIVLYSSKNPSYTGDEIIFEAVVTPKGSTLVPEGTVVFKDGTTTIGNATLNNGKASLPISDLTAGIHQITAAYSSTNDFNSGTSNAVMQSVADATLELVSGLNPSTEDEPVTFTATVKASANGDLPAGTVTFSDGTTTLGSLTLSGGAALFTTDDLTSGVHTITAEYSGNYGSLTATLTQTVSSSVSMVLVSSKNPQQVNTPVTFTATVTASGSPVNGAAVSFYNNGALFKTASSDVTGNATADFEFKTTGNYFIEARSTGQTASLTQVIKTKVKSAEIEVVSEFQTGVPILKVYPNPFDDRLKFEFSSPEPVHARIDVYDMTGRMIETVFDQPIEGKTIYHAEFKPLQVVSAMYIYKIAIGKKIYIDKALYKNRE